MSENRSSAAMQDHIAELLRILGLGDHARPESPAAVMEHEVIPAVRRLSPHTPTDSSSSQPSNTTTPTDTGSET